jgi:drug/metabolite transporter (DMT)-like permease
VSYRAKVWIALWAVYIIWGSTYLGIAVAGDTIPPLLAVSTRFVAAGALMAAVVTWRGGSLRIGRRELGWCIVIGCLLPGANAVLFFAETEIPTGIASLIIASVPLWVVLLRLGAGEKMRGATLAGVGIGFIGVAVLLRPSGAATTEGVLLCLLSAVMWAVGSFAAARVTMPRHPFTATTYEMLAGGLVMLPFALATTDFGELSPSAGSIVAWIYLVTFGSLVGYTAYSWLLHHAPLATVSTYAYVNPVVAIILGVLFRDESITVQILIGAAIVVAAVAVVVRQEPPAATQPEEGVR